MTRWDESVFDPYLPADLVLRQAEIGVIAADRQGNVLFVNEYAARLLRLPADAAKLAGQPLVTIGFIPECDLPKADDMTRQVLRGQSWEGTFSGSTDRVPATTASRSSGPSRCHCGRSRETSTAWFSCSAIPPGATRSASRTGSGCWSG